MSKRVIEMFLFDIYIEIQKIKHIAKAFDNVQSLLHDFRAWDSIIREFEIIGEASNHLLKNNLLDQRYRQVVNFRNKIIHEYFGIEPDEIWHIITKDLDDFEKTILKLIESMDNELKEELRESFITDNHYLDFVVKKLEAIH